MIKVNMIDMLSDEQVQIARLLEQLGYHQESLQLNNRVKDFINMPGYGLALAKEDHNFVGLVAWSKSMCFVNDKTRLRIEALIVDSEDRHRGVGSMLINFVENFAKQFSPCIIELTSGMRRKSDGSHDFYDKTGYKNVGITEKLYLRKEV